ncbi:unnamed protein product [Vicia faba]|uniref:Uncharacterized protein n=1 Tax=Vicia faba TaxID=3906 RepID=A0AAV0YKL0_VICFA|nr:unnamed protein product [Vicia faba]
MPMHDQGINAVDDDLLVSFVGELTTPLPVVKKNLLRVSLFLGCGEGYHLCASLPNGYLLLKIRVQHLINDRGIIFEKTPSTRNLCIDVSIITIFTNPPRASSKVPVRITSTPKVSPLIITSPGPIPYSSNKAAPWNYGADIYYHGVKQDPLAIKNEATEDTNPNIDNIVGTSKSPEAEGFSLLKSLQRMLSLLLIPLLIILVATHIVTPVVIHATESTETRRKEVLVKPARTKAPKEDILESS